MSSSVSAVSSPNEARKVWCGWGSKTNHILVVHQRGEWARSASVRHVILYITVQHRLQLGKEDDCSSPCMLVCAMMHVYMCACIFVLCMCMPTPQTTPHHTTYSLIRFIDSGVFLQDNLWSAESTTTSQSSLISMAFDLHLSHTYYLCTQLTTTPLTSPCRYIYI